MIDVCLAVDSTQSDSSLVFYVSVSGVCCTIVLTALFVFICYVRSRSRPPTSRRLRW